jgi:DNA-binding SARP family transcriptional activator/TolB-like protein/tetratricopeptide (TPR) repeat protein
MIELRALGTTTLNEVGVGEIGSVLAQPKRMALLVYLATARPRGFHHRSTLHALFWPEQDERHARWSLNQSLRYLREALGSGVVRSRGAEEIGLGPLTIWCDAVAFETAHANQRWEAALELYRGDLLPGFYVSGCVEFEHWLEVERTELRRLASRAAWALANCKELERDLTAAADSARRAIQLSPHDETGIRRLIDLLDRSGDRAGAVEAYVEYVRRLRAEVDVDPAPETQAVIARIRSRVEAATTPRPAAEAAAPPGILPELAPAERPGATEHRTLRLRSARHFLVLGAGVLSLAAAVWWVARAPSSGSSAPRSIAVLPCTSIVQDTQRWYLGEIITQDLITEVAKSRLFEKVIASASVARYRGSSQSPQKIGAELGVEALLYCEYRLFGSQEHVRVQLVDRRTATLLWTDDFEHDLTVATGATLPAVVVDALSRAAGLGRSGRAPNVLSTPTQDLRALNLYKEGQYFLSRFTEDAVHRSIYLFNEALARDSGFALPYVGIARAYHLLGIAFGSMEPREAFPLMKQAADRALALDDGLADAHALLGEYEMAFGWNWTMAEQHLRQAIKLDPYAPHALQSLAYYLTIVGRYDEAPELTSRAIDVSPVDPIVWNNAGRNYFLAGRFEDARPFLQKGLELAPDFPPLLLEAGHLYTESGEISHGVEYLQRADSLSGHQVIIRGRLAYAYALSGDSVAARGILRQLKRDAAAWRPPAKTATAIAVVYIGLGERDSAFAWMDVAYEQRSGNLVHVLRTPAGWRLASDPRYRALLDRLGLEPAALAPVAVATAKPK